METAVTGMPPASSARPFSAGDVIGRSFSVWFGSFVPFSIVTLVINLPLLVLVTLAPPEGGRGLEVVANLLSGLGNIVVTGALTYGVLHGLKGTPVPLGTLLKTGFTKLWRVFLVGFGFGLIVLVGFLLLVVPGVIAICALYVAVPAVVVEDVRPEAALGRSRALTKGSRWAIFAVVLVATAVAIVTAVASGVVALLGASALPHPVPALLATSIVVLGSPFAACASAVAYHDLRLAKEGVDTTSLVKVFE